jgi:peptide/nickel transport system permease protein
MAVQPKVAQLTEEEEAQYIGRSLLQLALSRLRRDNLTLIAITIVLLLTLMSILAPFISDQILMIDYAHTKIINAFLPSGGKERIVYQPDYRLRSKAFYSMVIIDHREDFDSVLLTAEPKALTENPENGGLFFVNGSVGAPDYDVYLDGADKPAFSQIVFGAGSDFLSLTPKKYAVALRTSGAPASDKPLYEFTADITSGHVSTAVMLGTQDGTGDQAFGVSVYAAETNNIEADHARLQVFIASSRAPVSNVYLNNQVSPGELKFKQDTIIDTDSASKTISLSAVNAKAHILGTDDLGRDHLARLMYGGQVSLGIGFLAASISLAIGVALGIITGFYGGIIDDIVTWLITTLNSLPFLLLLLIIVAVFNPGPLTLILTLGFLGWTGTTRLVRGETFSIRAREYIVSARAIGAPVSRIMLVHILPNLLSIVLITLALDIGGLILTESALSFLGFGIKPPTPSWGNMLTNAQTFFTKGVHLVIFPGLMISITVLCLYIIGDGLRDAFDPTLRN